MSEGQGDTPHFTKESPSKAQGELKCRHRLSSPKRKRRKLFQVRAENTRPSTSPEKEKVSPVHKSPTKAKFREGREAHSTLPADDATLLDQSEGEGETPHFTEESPSEAQGELEGDIGFPPRKGNAESCSRSGQRQHPPALPHKRRRYPEFARLQRSQTSRRAGRLTAPSQRAMLHSGTREKGRHPTSPRSPQVRTSRMGKRRVGTGVPIRSSSWPKVRLDRALKHRQEMKPQMLLIF